MKRLIVGITGASGAIYGVRILERLRDLPVETHLVASRWARVTIEHETDYSFNDVKRLADVVHSEDDQAATISSGSFLTEGMVIAPSSTKTARIVKTICGTMTSYMERVAGLRFLEVSLAFVSGGGDSSG